MSCETRQKNETKKFHAAVSRMAKEFQSKRKGCIGKDGKTVTLWEMTEGFWKHGWSILRRC